MPDIANAVDVGSCIGTQSQDSCVFECENGYTPSSSLNCLRGEFDIQACLENPCLNPPEIAYSTVEDCVDVASGDTCLVRCLDGYHPSVVDGTETCYLGNWNVSMSCDPDPCDLDPVIDFMDSQATVCENTQSGDECEVQCDAGYTAHGQASCSLGTWHFADLP